MFAITDPENDSHSLLVLLLIAIVFIYQVWMFATRTTKEMNEFKNTYNEAINEIKETPITRDDFNLNLLNAEQNNTSDSNLLDN